MEWLACARRFFFHSLWTTTTESDTAPKKKKNFKTETNKNKKTAYYETHNVDTTWSWAEHHLIVWEITKKKSTNTNTHTRNVIIYFWIVCFSCYVRRSASNSRRDSIHPSWWWMQTAKKAATHMAQEKKSTQRENAKWSFDLPVKSHHTSHSVRGAHSTVFCIFPAHHFFHSSCSIEDAMNG